MWAYWIVKPARQAGAKAGAHTRRLKCSGTKKQKPCRLEALVDASKIKIYIHMYVHT